MWRFRWLSIADFLLPSNKLSPAKKRRLGIFFAFYSIFSSCTEAWAEQKADQLRTEWKNSSSVSQRWKKNNETEQKAGTSWLLLLITSPDCAVLGNIKHSKDGWLEDFPEESPVAACNATRKYQVHVECRNSPYNASLLFFTGRNTNEQLLLRFGGSVWSYDTKNFFRFLEDDKWCQNQFWFHFSETE